MELHLSGSKCESQNKIPGCASSLCNLFSGFNVKDETMEIGDGIICYREAMGLSAREFATRFGVDVDVLHRWECSKEVPPVYFLNYLRLYYESFPSLFDYDVIVEKYDDKVSTVDSGLFSCFFNNSRYDIMDVQCLTDLIDLIDVIRDGMSCLENGSVPASDLIGPMKTGCDAMLQYLKQI